MFQPMYNYIPKRFWDDLMYMGNEGGVYLYKHDMTRAYINVDKKGNFYSFTGSKEKSYVLIDKVSAIESLRVIDKVIYGWKGGTYDDSGLFNSKEEAERGYMCDNKFQEMFDEFEGKKIEISVRILED